MRRGHGLVLCGFAGALAVTTPALSSAASAPLPRYGAFIFSNLCVAAQSGDVEGSRISLMRRKDADVLLYEYGNGPLEGPFVAQHVKVKGGVLRASALTDDGEVSLKGSLDEAGGMLTALSGKPTPVKRLKRFDAPIPGC